MKRLKILFVFMLLGTLFVSQMSGNAATSATTITYTKGNNETDTIATQDTTYTAGSNISIDASNQISAVLPVIKVDSTGKIQDQDSQSITASYVNLSSPDTAVSNASSLPNAAGAYLVYEDGYIPKVAIVTYNKTSNVYSFK